MIISSQSVISAPKQRNAPVIRIEGRGTLNQQPELADVPPLYVQIHQVVQKSPI
jgi:hypothetical protein